MKARCAVADTSPLQYLHQIGYLDLLAILFKTILIPDAVTSELRQGISKGFDLPQCETLPGFVISSPTAGPIDLTEGLHLGERCAIALAVQLECPVVLDDLAARYTAMHLGLTVIG